MKRYWACRIGEEAKNQWRLECAEGELVAFKLAYGGLPLPSRGDLIIPLGTRKREAIKAFMKIVREATSKTIKIGKEK